MTPLDESFRLWASKHAQDDHLPWETSREVLFQAFTAGWHSHAESLKQTDLWPGTLDGSPILAGCRTGKSFAGEAQLAEQSTRNALVAGSSPASGSTITAEDIYAAWPVKKARGAAIMAIKKAMNKEPAANLLAAVHELAECYKAWPVTELQYLPMCSTFMNQERWSDDRRTWRKGAAATPSQFRTTNS